MAESKKRRSDIPPAETPAGGVEDTRVESAAPVEVTPEPQPDAVHAGPAATADLFFTESLHSNAETVRLIERLTDIAEPGVIFSPPLTIGDQVVITASELLIGLGAGFAAGGGADPEHPGAGGSGGGGGGGGSSFGRPVAVISVGPQGVKVEPVVDVTKIAITFFTAFGAMFLALRSMRRFGKG